MWRGDEFVFTAPAHWYLNFSSRLRLVFSLIRIWSLTIFYQDVCDWFRYVPMSYYSLNASLLFKSDCFYSNWYHISPKKESKMISLRLVNCTIQNYLNLILKSKEYEKEFDSNEYNRGCVCHVYAYWVQFQRTRFSYYACFCCCCCLHEDSVRGYFIRP